MRRAISVNREVFSFADKALSTDLSFLLELQADDPLFFANPHRPFPQPKTSPLDQQRKRWEVRRKHLQEASKPSDVCRSRLVRIIRSRAGERPPVDYVIPEPRPRHATFAFVGGCAELRERDAEVHNRR